MNESGIRIALIGGTGLNQLPGLEVTGEYAMETPYGSPSAPLVSGRLENLELVFLARHGPGHGIPPHRINYRANLWALKEFGIEQVIAVAAVGGITAQMRPGRIAIPDQIVDYTWGRAHTYYEGGESGVEHIDFTHPYNDRIRTTLIETAHKNDIDAIPEGVYGATQGPRLESASEIRRLQRDGCNLVGMTGMPETSLARELGMDYACIAAVVNWAAGVGDGAIHADIETFMARAIGQVNTLVSAALSQIRGARSS